MRNKINRDKPFREKQETKKDGKKFGKKDDKKNYPKFKDKNEKSVLKKDYRAKDEEIPAEREGRDLIYGRHPVLEAIRNEAPLNKAWILENSRNLGQIIDLLKEHDVPYKLTPKEFLDKLAGKNVNHQGVVVELAGKEYTDFAEVIELSKSRPVFLIVLDKIEDPHNLGAIIRTADAVGVDAIIIPKHRAAGLTGIVAKTSAGAIQRMKVCRVTNLTQTMDILKQHNVWLAGVDLDGKDIYSQANLKGSVAIVVGGEGKGLTKSVKDQCDFVVKIPMQSAANSLNASVATAIVIYEVYRQRGFNVGQ